MPEATALGSSERASGAPPKSGGSHRRDPERVGALAREAGVPEVVARLLLGRGVATPAEAAEFFDPDPARLHDPFLMKGIEEAADVLLRRALGPGGASSSSATTTWTA